MTNFGIYVGSSKCVPKKSVEDITLHQAVNDTSTEDGSQTDKEANKKLVTNTVADTITWKRYYGNEFKLLHDYTDSIVLQYSKPPPIIDGPSSSSSKKKRLDSPNQNFPEKADIKTLWCMSSIPKTDLEMSDNSSARSSPTDFLRYKTKILIKDSPESWKRIWKKLQRSLQGGELEYCNACYEERQEILIFHFGWQQALVGEWVWKNVNKKYSKTTTLITCD